MRRLLGCLLLAVAAASILASPVVCAGSHTTQTVVQSQCTQISGDLVISSSAGNGLDGLAALRQVGGSVSILANAELTDLTGLHGVESVGGDLRIIANPSLKSLTGLSSLMVVGGELHIEHNLALTTLEGLVNVSLHGLRIIGNPALPNTLALCGHAHLASGASVDADPDDVIGSCPSMQDPASPPPPPSPPPPNRRSTR
jgi:hypothetical protein